MGEVRKTICRMRRRKMVEFNNIVMFNNIVISESTLKELLNIARRLASRESRPEPHSEYCAKVALDYYSGREKLAIEWELGFVFSLSCMEMALELEKDRKELEITAEELASRNSKPELESERYARCALEAHKEGDQKLYDIFLFCMGWHLKKENILSGGKRWKKSIEREWLKELVRNLP